MKREERHKIDEQVLQYVKDHPDAKYKDIMEQFYISRERIHYLLKQNGLLSEKKRKFDHFGPRKLNSRKESIKKRRSPEMIKSSNYYKALSAPIEEIDSSRVLKEKLQMIRDYNAGKKIEEIAIELHRSSAAIQAEIDLLIAGGYIKNTKAPLPVEEKPKPVPCKGASVTAGTKPWDDDEVATLIAQYNSGMRAAALAPLHGRTAKAVNRKLEKLRAEGRI